GTRSDVRGLEAAGIPFVLNNVMDEGSSNQDRTVMAFATDNPYGINLIHVNADSIARFAQQKGGAYLRGRYNIGYWAWELSTFPVQWRPSFQYLDEVWVPSNFVLNAVSHVSPVPVVRMPHCLAERVPTKSWDWSHFGLTRNEFVVLF